MSYRLSKRTFYFNFHTFDYANSNLLKKNTEYTLSDILNFSLFADDRSLICKDRGVWKGHTI